MKNKRLRICIDVVMPIQCMCAVSQGSTNIQNT